MHICTQMHARDTRSTSGPVVRETIPCLDALSGKRGREQTRKIAEISFKKKSICYSSSQTSTGWCQSPVGLMLPIKKDHPGKKETYWFCYCVLNIKVEPGCSKIILEIFLLRKFRWTRSTVTKTASAAVWTDAQTFGINDGKVQEDVPLWVGGPGSCSGMEGITRWSASHSQHHYIALVPQENSSSWTCGGADMLHIVRDALNSCPYPPILPHLSCCTLLSFITLPLISGATC